MAVIERHKRDLDEQSLRLQKELDALRAFATNVGMAEEDMLDGVTMGDDGEILEIDWSGKDLKGTFTGAPNMPSLRELDLIGSEWQPVTTG